MLDALAKLFSPQEERGPEPPDTDLAVAALLVHLTAIDGTVSQNERAVLREVLREHLEIEERELDELIEKATRKDREAVDFYKFTTALAGLEEEKRLEIIRMMWELVFADGKNHEMEDNMVWRVAELLHVSTRDRTQLRKKVKAAAPDDDAGDDAGGE